MSKLDRRFVFASVVWLASLGACGGSDSGSQSRDKFSSGLPSVTPIAEIADSDVAQFCTAFSGWAAKVLPESRLKPAVCRLTGIATSILVSGGSAAVCAEIYNECMTMPLDEENALLFDDAACASSIKKPCAATIGDIEACLSAIPGAIDAIPSCDKISSIDGDDDLEALLNPPACAKVEQTCPGFLSGD